MVGISKNLNQYCQTCYYIFLLDFYCNEHAVHRRQAVCSDFVPSFLSYNCLSEFGDCIRAEKLNLHLFRTSFTCQIGLLFYSMIGCRTNPFCISVSSAAVERQGEVKLTVDIQIHLHCVEMGNMGADIPFLNSLRPPSKGFSLDTDPTGEEEARGVQQ